MNMHIDEYDLKMKLEFIIMICFSYIMLYSMLL